MSGRPREPTAISVSTAPMNGLELVMAHRHTARGSLPWLDAASSGTVHDVYGVSLIGWFGFVRSLATQDGRGAAADGERAGEANARANHLLQVPVDIKAPGRLILGASFVRDPLEIRSPVSG